MKLLKAKLASHDKLCAAYRNQLRRLLHWALGVGRWALDVGRWTLDVERWTFALLSSLLARLGFISLKTQP
jgi:hypothetical protein